ncbi:addiction module antidote protein, HigA family [Chitinophagaceae bacterium IBVUCB1]|nr:addiction module antidote protein, HigA family [Chitinophagaceae bacterium IBVUCB1]
MTKNNYIVIGKNGEVVRNEEFPLHPGNVIEMEIEARGLKKQNVAKQLGILPGHLSELLKEKRHVSALLALKLEALFSIDAEFWLRVQNGYDLIKARKKLAKSA